MSESSSTRKTARKTKFLCLGTRKASQGRRESPDPQARKDLLIGRVSQADRVSKVYKVKLVPRALRASKA